MAAVLTNGKGFYHPLVYVLESHRLGLKFLPRSVNEPGPAFVPHGDSMRVPVTRVKGLTTRTTDAMIQARERGVFTALSDFFHRVAPAGEELETMIRAGAFDEFGETRTRQFWQAQHLIRTYTDTRLIAVKCADLHLDLRDRAKDPWSTRTLVSYLYDGTVSPGGFDILDYYTPEDLPLEHLRELFRAKRGTHILRAAGGVYLYHIGS